MSHVDEEISDISGLVKKADFNAKITEAEGRIPSISGLATSSALTSVDNKISGLVTKTDFAAKLKKVSDRVASNKTKHLLVENKLKKLEKFDAA